MKYQYEYEIIAEREYLIKIAWNTEKEWIDPGHTPEKAVTFLDPIPDTLLMAYTISRLISKRGVEKNVPDLVKPFSYEEESLW